MDIENFDIKAVKTNLKIRYKCYWKSKILNNKKLDTYCKFKRNFEREVYLTNIENSNHRKYLTRLRISAHHLAIETGRYKKKNKKKNDRDQRLCVTCNKVEDEAHFLFECKCYNNLRDTYISTVCNYVPNFRNLSNENKLIYIMTSEDHNLNNISGEYIFNCFKSREEAQLSPSRK